MSKETNYSRGVMAEGKASSFLEGNKFNILKKRYKTKFGEIDIIAEKGNVLCFVEVKMRGTITEALESVTPRSQKRIENSALLFLSENLEYTDYDMRFDVIAITKGVNGDFSITYLDNAWEATTIAF